MSNFLNISRFLSKYTLSHLSGKLFGFVERKGYRFIITKPLYPAILASFKQNVYVLSPFSASAVLGFKAIHIRARVHRRLSTSFRQILLHTALKILAIRKYACKFLPCLQKNLLENPHIFPMNTSSQKTGAA